MEIELEDIRGTKHDCTTSMTVKTILSDFTSTETEVHEHRTTSTVVEMELYDILKDACTTSTVVDIGL